MNPTSSSSPTGSESISHGWSPLPVSCQQPLQNSPTFEDANATTIREGEMIPQPLERLQGTQMATFLSKTFDLVDDPILNPIISWDSSGQSFIVWDPGFCKIDPDKWEFANESFLRGQKHLLKNIQRRRSNQSLSTNSSSEEFNNLLVEAEIKRLQKEKMEMMQQIIELKNKNCETRQFMESVKDELKAAEHKQRQMVSFLAKMFQNPTFGSSSPENHDQMLKISSPRTNRKFVKHQTHEQSPLSIGGASRNLEFGSEIEDRESKGKNVMETESEIAPDYLLEQLSGGIDGITVKQEDIWSDLGNYELPEFGAVGGELSEFWNFGISGGENWQRDDSFKKTDS